MKNKGIVIELTALLDVILIMLFWVMMNVQDSNETVRADAESRIAAAQQQLEEQKVQSEQELKSLRSQTDKEVAEAHKLAESINADAYANQQALNGYEQGLLVTLNLKYAPSGELYILNNSRQIGSSNLSSKHEVAENIVSSLKNAGMDRGDVILCAMVFDGNTALYSDVQTVSSAVNEVRGTYEKFYCTYINTAK